MTDAPADHVRAELVRFARALRREGATVPANAGRTAGRALAEVGFDDRDRARTALRATLVSDRADLDAFDRLFPTFWRRLTAGLDAGDADAAGADDADGGPALEMPTIEAGEPGDREAAAGDDASGGAASLGAVRASDADGADAEETRPGTAGRARPRRSPPSR
ncbi:MAG: hypothetical protein ABEJ23_01045 [Haloarculaceae archaeon]